MHRIMLRIALRNILIMIGVALPIFVATGMVIGWSGDNGNSRPSLEALAGSFIYVYALWVLPALAIAVIHQVVLAPLPPSWSTRTTWTRTRSPRRYTLCVFSPRSACEFSRNR